MRKRLCLIMSLIITASLVGCGSAKQVNSTKNSSAEKVVESADVDSKSDSETSASNQIEFKNIKLSAVDGAKNGKTACLLSVTNNTPYTLLELRLTFKTKDNLNEQSLKEAFSNFKTYKGGTITDTQFKDIRVESEADQLTDPGKTIENLDIRACTASQNLGDIDSKKEYDVMKPEVIEVEFIGDDGKIHSGDINCTSGTYTDSGETKAAYEWPDSNLTTVLPKPSAKVVKVNSNYERDFSADAYGISSDEFSSYVKQCKDRGFTKAIYPESEKSYDADTESGDLRLLLDYSSQKEKMSIHIALMKSATSTSAVTPTPTTTPTPTVTAAPTATPKPATTAAVTESTTYQSILDEYTKKIQDTTPTLVSEYNQRASQNTNGVSGLAQICNEEVQKLAVINNEGVQKMASAYWASGSGKYEEYQDYATKLTNVYMTESQKITNAYMASATG